MEIIEILGYFGALIIGVVLGLIGGGGSILTVPILVYMFGINPVLATAYSLFIVGLSSLFGAIRNMQKKLVDFKTAVVFSIPAFIAVYSTRMYLVPAIPESLFYIGDFEITKNIAIMAFFALIMLLASISMIKNKKKKLEAKEVEKVSYNYPLIILEGVVVGVVTGIVGAGGGFLIIPALVLLAKLPMKQAVATSLLIISVKSLIGFLGDVQNYEIDWTFLGIFTALAAVGIFVGIWLNKFIDGAKLKKGFGWFLVVMGIFIFYNLLTE